MSGRPRYTAVVEFTPGLRHEDCVYALEEIGEHLNHVKLEDRVREARFVAGDVHKAEGADHVTYGIHDMMSSGGSWGNRIEVHGDPALRDEILRLLNR